MAFLGEGERPRDELEPVRQTHLTPAEQHDVAGEPQGRNPFVELLVGETPPYSPEVFDKVDLKLVDMRDDFPSQNWYGWSGLRREDRDDVIMVAEGFRAVAYNHFSPAVKAHIKDRCYEAATREYSAAEWFTENHRVYRDRFELTYRQALAVQKVMRYLGEDYDPGGEEPTPENLAKRTFYYDAYLHKPDTYDPDDLLSARPWYHEEIAAYLQAKHK